MRHTSFFALASVSLGFTILVANGCSSSGSSTADTPAAAGEAGVDSDGEARKEASVLPDIDAASACVPAEVTGFSPTWSPPTAFGQRKCTESEVALVIGCQFDGTPDADTCDTALTSARADGCYDCLFTDVSSANWGPVVVTKDGGTLNTGGCIANTMGDSSSTGCGASYAAARDCGFAACDGNCAGDDVTEAQYDACRSQAASGNCSSYAKAAECAQSGLGPAATAQCETTDGFDAAALRLGILFCAGGPAADAGTADAADAASD